MPFYHVPDNAYTLLDSIKSLEDTVRDERNKLLHKMALTAEYQQTLEEFAEIVQLSQVLVDSKLSARHPQEAVRELEKRKRFLFGLRHFLTVLETLEEHLDPVTRSLHQELHLVLVSQAGNILEDSVQRQQKIQALLDIWQNLDDQWIQEENWFQELQLRMPDASSISAEEFNDLDVTFNVSSYFIFNSMYILIG